VLNLAVESAEYIVTESPDSAVSLESWRVIVSFDTVEPSAGTSVPLIVEWLESGGLLANAGTGKNRVLTVRKNAAMRGKILPFIYTNNTINNYCRQFS
jgi:hypothetical protein